MRSRENSAPQRWRKSSFSANNDCVECRSDRGTVLVRDTKSTSGAVLSVSSSGWAEFIASFG